MLNNIISSKNFTILVLLVFVLLILTCMLKSNKSIENYSNGTLENVKTISIEEKIKILNKAFAICRMRVTDDSNSDTVSFSFFYVLTDNLSKLYQLACNLKNIDDNYYNLDCSDPNSLLQADTGAELYGIYSKMMEISNICKNQDNNTIRICADFNLILDNLIVSCINYLETNDNSCPCEGVSNTHSINTYRGCYKDDTTRDLPIEGGNLSLEECSNLAKKSNKVYFGLQNQGGVPQKQGVDPDKNVIVGECRIGDTFGTYGPSSNCKEIDNNMWGQTWSNSVYSIDKQPLPNNGKCNPC